MKIFLAQTFYLFTIISMLAWGCKKVDGLATSPKFDSSHIIPKSGIDTIITAKNNVNWFFSNIYVGDKSISFDDPSVKFYTDAITPNSTSDHGPIFRFDGDWFSIEKIDNKNIRIVIIQNQSGSERTISFIAQAGDAPNKIHINQQG